MSLFACMDELNSTLANLDNLSFWQNTMILLGIKTHDLEKERTFILALQKILQKRINDDNYQDLLQDVDTITKFLMKNEKALSYSSLHKIADYLLKISSSKKSHEVFEGLLKARQELLILKQPELAKTGYQAKDYANAFEFVSYQPNKNADLDILFKHAQKNMVAYVNQGVDYRKAACGGECYGYTIGFSESGENEVLKGNTAVITFNNQIYRYQKNQMVRQHDQQTIKRNRITMKTFCSDPCKQADEIYTIAQQHQGEKLLLDLYGKMDNRHACYISLLSDNSLCYMDPNHVAYRFSSKEEFIELFAACSRYKYDNKYCFYRLDCLVLDKDNTNSEKKSWMGVLRTLLTGEKYNHWVTNTLSCLLLIGLNVGILIALSLLFPGVGTYIALGISFAFSVACLIDGHRGILGGVHFVQSCWHRLKNWMNPTTASNSIVDSSPTLKNVENNTSFSSLHSKGITALSKANLDERATSMSMPQEAVNSSFLFSNPSEPLVKSQQTVGLRLGPE